MFEKRFNNYKNINSFNEKYFFFLYPTGLTPSFMIAIGIASLLFLIIFIIFLIQIPAKLKQKQFTTRTLILLSYYPIVGAAALISIILPKAIILSDTICHFSFTICAYQFFCLCIDYAEGESNFIKLAGEQFVFSLRVPPCCCMVCVKPMLITKFVSNFFQISDNLNFFSFFIIISDENLKC